jgi:hypothetical protein
VRPGQFIHWQDLFVLVDDGSISLARYMPVASVMHERAKLFPQGIACFCILPPGAKPPPDDVKRFLKEQLTILAPSLSCLTYVIEGSGFKAVAARAALISMKVFASRPYPIYVETSVREGLIKVLPHLVKGTAATADVAVIMKMISDARKAWAAAAAAAAAPSPIHVGDMTVK